MVRCSLSRCVVLVGGLVVALAAQAQLKIGVISSSTGPASLVGIPQKNTVALLPKTIAGLSVEYLQRDDASEPTQAVTEARKLISEQHIDALIGPTSSPAAAGVISFVAEAGVPMLAPVGSSAVVLPMDDKKRWVFKTTQNDDIIVQALVDHMVKNKIKTVGVIAVNDPLGETQSKVFLELAAKHGIKVVANEKYLRSDTSVAAQALKLLSAEPDAVFVAGAGGPVVLPQTTLVDQGYTGRFYQTHGAALPAFLQLGGKKVENTILAASLMLVLPEVPDSHPSKKVAASYIAAYEKLYGSKPATFGANVFDAGLLLQTAVPVALKKGQPGTPAFRAALRDALEGIKELVGTQGVYNMSPQDHSGFDQRGRELITVKNGNWALVK